MSHWGFNCIGVWELSVLTKSWLAVNNFQKEAFLGFLPLKETTLLGQETMVCSKSPHGVSNQKRRLQGFISEFIYSVILDSHENHLNM